MTTIITLNDTIRNIARRNPAALLAVIVIYNVTGRVNSISEEILEEAIEKSHKAGRYPRILKREDFDTDVAYNDQVHQLTIIKAFSTNLCYGFTADNIPAMIDELYDRMESRLEVWDAYTGISESARIMEDAFMSKARAELW